MTDILDITDEVVVYLTELMANVARYLTSKSYLSQTIR